MEQNNHGAAAVVQVSGNQDSGREVKRHTKLI